MDFSIKAYFWANIFCISLYCSHSLMIYVGSLSKNLIILYFVYFDTFHWYTNLYYRLTDFLVNYLLMGYVIFVKLKKNVKSHLVGRVSSTVIFKFHVWSIPIKIRHVTLCGKSVKFNWGSPRNGLVTTYLKWSRGQFVTYSMCHNCHILVLHFKCCFKILVQEGLKLAFWKWRFCSRLIDFIW